MTDRIDKLLAMLKAEPNDAFCLYALGHEYAKAGDTDQAIDYYRRTIESDPDELYAYYHLAKCQQDHGDGESAKSTLQSGLTKAEAVGDAKAVDEMRELLEALDE